MILYCSFWVQVRYVPENFNETKYIAFAMYTNCILWLCFVVVYFGARQGEFRVRPVFFIIWISRSTNKERGLQRGVVNIRVPSLASRRSVGSEVSSLIIGEIKASCSFKSRAQIA